MSQPSSPRISGDGSSGSSSPPLPPLPPPQEPVLEDKLQDELEDMQGDLGAVSLDSDPSPPPPPPQKDTAHEANLNSPPPATPPKLAAAQVDLTDTDEEGGDIGASAPSPHSPSSSVPRLLSSSSSSESLSSRRHQTVEPLYLTTTRSAHEREHSRARSQDSNRSSHSHRPSHSVSPVRDGRTSTSISMRPTPSPGAVVSPRYRSIDIVPSVSVKDEDEEVDPTAPFESVSLDDTPTTQAAPPRLSTSSVREAGPGTPGSVALSLGQGHERNSSRASGTGSITGAINGARLSESYVRKSTPSTPASASFTSGSSTPRRHAPPAHPHPFPIPTSPIPSNVPVPQVSDPNAGPSKSPNLSSTATVPTPGQALGVKGQSAFDKFMSRTRPSHLPPKDKAEDDTHLHEWENMMAKAREHEAERRRVAEARRLEREKHLVAVTPRWETLLRDRDAISKVKNDESNRKLWFEGIPPHLRGRAWSLAIGNALAMHKDAYNMYLKRARRAIENGRFPPDIQNQLEDDMDQTLPILHVFQRGSPVRDELRDLVSAWVVYRSDEGQGYAPYITLLAAMFILVSPAQEAFLSLCNLLARPCMHAFYSQIEDEIAAFYRVFENLQADMFPRIYANCKNLGLQLPQSYFRSVLVEQVPFDAACRLWDQIVLEGDGYIFRAALAIFGFLEPRLYYPDKDEIESVLEGRNAATMAIAEREKERAKLRGERYEDALDGKLSVFGLHEDALFDWLANDGWRDSRFERLTMRELPD